MLSIRCFTSLLKRSSIFPKYVRGWFCLILVKSINYQNFTFTRTCTKRVLKRTKNLTETDNVRIPYYESDIAFTERVYQKYIEPMRTGREGKKVPGQREENFLFELRSNVLHKMTTTARGEKLMEVSWIWLFIVFITRFKSSRNKCQSRWVFHLGRTTLWTEAGTALEETKWIRGRIRS